MTRDARNTAIASVLAVVVPISIGLGIGWAACVPSPTAPRQDATDSAWQAATLPPGFDAGAGGGGGF